MHPAPVGFLPGYAGRVAGADAWRNPRVRHALARVEQADADLEAAVHRSRQVEQDVRESPRFPQRLRDVEDYARSRAAPRALRDLQQRIDNGELSWHGIAAGNHLDDPQVRAALAAGITEPLPVDDDGDPRDARGYAFSHFDPDAAD
jgi:hypothetical protein